MPHVREKSEEPLPEPGSPKKSKDEAKATAGTPDTTNDPQAEQPMGDAAKDAPPA